MGNMLIHKVTFSQNSRRENRKEEGKDLLSVSLTFCGTRSIIQLKVELDVELL